VKYLDAVKKSVISELEDMLQIKIEEKYQAFEG
jgi:hypothetical protein